MVLFVLLLSQCMVLFVLLSQTHMVIFVLLLSRRMAPFDSCGTLHLHHHEIVLTHDVFVLRYVYYYTNARYYILLRTCGTSTNRLIVSLHGVFSGYYDVV